MFKLIQCQKMRIAQNCEKCNNFTSIKKDYTVIIQM
jgi:hypothetical protein